MREGWQHGDGELTLDAAEVSRLVREAIPTASVTAFRPAVGGLSNTNIEVELADAPHRVLLRLYQRDRAAAQREAALSALVLQQACRRRASSISATGMAGPMRSSNGSRGHAWRRWRRG